MDNDHSTDDKINTVYEAEVDTAFKNIIPSMLAATFIQQTVTKMLFKAGVVV